MCTTVQNVIENSPLMKKTKAQLVEIILRKDEVERELREAIKISGNDFNSLNDKFDELKELSDELMDEHQKLKELHETVKANYEEECDEHITDVELAKHTIKRYKKWTMFSLLAYVVLIVIAIFL